MVTIVVHRYVFSTFCSECFICAFVLLYYLDHTVIACYLGLYEEGEVKHISGVKPGYLELWLVSHQNIRI